MYRMAFYNQLVVIRGVHPPGSHNHLVVCVLKLCVRSPGKAKTPTAVGVFAALRPKLERLTRRSPCNVR